MWAFTQLPSEISARPDIHEALQQPVMALIAATV